MSKKKFKKVTVGGLHTYVAIEKDHDRPLFPRPAVFSSRKKYDRNREKAAFRKEVY